MPGAHVLTTLEETNQTLLARAQFEIFSSECQPSSFVYVFECKSMALFSLTHLLGTIFPRTLFSPFYCFNLFRLAVSLHAFDLNPFFSSNFLPVYFIPIHNR